MTFLCLRKQATNTLEVCKKKYKSCSVIKRENFSGFLQNSKGGKDAAPLGLKLLVSVRHREQLPCGGGNVAGRLGSQPGVSRLLALTQGRDLRVQAHSWQQQPGTVIQREATERTREKHGEATA